MTFSEVWRLSGMQRMLLLYVVMPLMLVVGVGMAFGLERLNHQESDRLKDDLELIGRAISLPIGEALVTGDDEAVRRTLQSIFAIGRVYGASVFDADGNQVAAAGIAERDLSRSRVAREVVMTGEQQDQYREVMGQEMYSYFIPVTDATGIPNGFIQINRRAVDFERSFERLTRAAWIIFAAVSLLTLAIVIFGHYGGIGRHVAGLREVMERVEQGDREVRANTDGPSEIATMARGLNRMLDSIARKDKELVAHQAQERALADQLRKREKMAAIGKVAGGVAHELGAPLTVIDGRARRLQKSVQAHEEQRQLSAIRGQVSRLTRIVRQLLNYTRSEVKEKAAPVVLNALVRDAIANVQHEDDSHVISFEVTMPDQEVKVMGFESRLELALVNVLRNAQQAAAARVEVELGISERGDITLQIRDDGEGLPEHKTHAQLLEPFVTTKQTGEGTGLGLAIVQQVMAEHHGSVELANRQRGKQVLGCSVTLSWLAAESLCDEEDDNGDRS